MSTSNGLRAAGRRPRRLVLGVWIFTLLKQLGQIELTISLSYVLLLGPSAR